MMAPREGTENLSVALNGRPFSQLPLHQRLKELLERHSLERTTVVQDLSLPELVRGRDVIVKAKRGSGKGVLVVVAVLDHILRLNEPPSQRPYSVVVTSSQERAKALSEWAKEFSEELDLDVAFFPEEDIKEEDLRRLEKGTEVLFTTLDGLNKALKWGLLKLSAIRFLVVDELEKMVKRSETFTKSVLSRFPPPQNRQTLVLLEELTYPALEVAYEITKDPEEIYVEEGRRDFSRVRLFVIHVAAEEKFPLLLGILRKKGWKKALIFVNEKVVAQKLVEDLKALGAKAVLLRPELPPPLRLNFLKLFARGEATIMVATDAGTRFIQDPELDLVINYDLPELPSDFLQRAARIKKEEGEVISICDETGAFFLESIEELVGKKMEVIFPEPEEEWFVSSAEVRKELSERSTPKRPSRPLKRRPTRPKVR